MRRWWVFGPIFFCCAFGGRMARADSAVGAEEPLHASSRWSVDHEIGIGVTGTFVRGTVIEADGGSANGATFDVGGQVDYLLAFPHHLRLGVGFRYAYGAGTTNEFNDRDVEQIAFVPILLGLAWWPRSRQELEVVAGIGLAWGRFTSTYVPTQSSASFDTLGAGVELTATYAFFLTDHLALFLGISGRASSGGNTRKDAAPIQGESALHGEIPALAGVRIRL